MVVSDVAVHDTPTTPPTERVVNDFSIQVATVNGSGSQTVNLVLLRSIFQMGVPVSGKTFSRRTSRDCLPGTRSEQTRTGTLHVRRESICLSR